MGNNRISYAVQPCLADMKAIIMQLGTTTTLPKARLHGQAKKDDRANEYKPTKFFLHACHHNSGIGNEWILKIKYKNKYKPGGYC
jgi:hypothetical protein